VRGSAVVSQQHSPNSFTFLYFFDILISSSLCAATLSRPSASACRESGEVVVSFALTRRSLSKLTMARAWSSTSFFSCDARASAGIPCGCGGVRAQRSECETDGRAGFELARHLALQEALHIANPLLDVGRCLGLLPLLAFATIAPTTFPAAA